MENTFLQFGGLGLAAFTVGLTFKFVFNHIKHNTRALTQLTDIIKQLKELLDKKL